MAEIVVRRAGRADAETVIGLIEALAQFEELDPPESEARGRFLEHGWPASGAEPRFQCWLAEYGSPAAPVGYAITFYTYSTFLCKPTIYLEDLFVLPSHRRLGAGKALIERIAREAVDMGCGRIEWVVLNWNVTAQQFYQRLGGVHLEEWQTYRLNEDAILRLVSGTDG